LISRLSDNAPKVNVRVARVLDAVTAKEHAPLLADAHKSRIAAVRRYVVARMAALHAVDHADVHRKLLKDGDPEVAFGAALGLAAAGETAQLEPVLVRCVAEWPELGARVTHALAPAKGEASSRWLLDRIAGKKDLEQIAGLRLLRAVGVKEHAAEIRKLLDASSHQVKKEAINALRVIVDGEPPIEDLSVFQVIEMATAMKKKG
jgi:hypothetical protein